MKTKLTEQENYQKASELKKMAEDWVDKEFNFIQVDVLNKCCDDMLFEYIRPEEPDYEEFLNNYSLWQEYKEYAEESIYPGGRTFNLSEKELKDVELMKSFCEEEHSNEFESWRNDREQENYPMWNTCFEFRYKPTEEILQACINAGFGIIEGMEDFNTLLFVAGAGYSFYGHHWIPAFLNMPWNDKLRNEYKNVNYYMI